MRNVSAAFHEAALSSDRTIAVKAVFNGNTEVDGSHIIDVSISETMFSDQALTMGEAFSSKTVINMYMPNSDAPVKSGYVDISVGLLVDGAFEYCNLGRFYISSAESNDNYKTVKITAFDIMSKLNVPYVPNPDSVYIPEDDEHYNPDNWDLSKTYVYMYNALLDIQWNHDLDESDFMYDGEIIAIPDGITERQLVAYIAGYGGGNAVVIRTDDDGDNYQRLACKWYTETDITITPEAQYQYGFKRIQEDDYVLESLTSGTAENVLVKGVGTGPVFTNPFMDIHQLNIIFNRVNGFTYTPCELKYRCDPSIEVGDIVTVVDVDGKSYKVPVMSQEIKISGGMSATIIAPGASAQELQNTVAGGNQVEISESDWVKIKTLIDSLGISGEIAKHNGDETSHNDLRRVVGENRNLLNAIVDDFSGVSDIVNNLNTNESQKPLSAAQGVALKKLIDAITVPTKTSQLTNDSEFMSTEEVVAKINEAISGVAGGLKFEIVDAIDTSSIGDSNTIYLVRSEDTDDNQYYDEYMFIESRGWEKLGDTRVSLDFYYTEQEVDNLLSELSKTIPIKTSQLYNDSGFVKASELETGEATWNSIKGNILYRVGTPVTWDGNTEGREVYEMKGSVTGTFYKVSDIVVKAEDIAGCTYYTKVGGDTEKIVPAVGEGFIFGLIEATYGWVFVGAGMVCLYDDSKGCSPGLYFNVAPYEYDNSKTEFVTKLIVEHDKVKKELLPDYFDVVGDGTLTWDGDATGKVTLDGSMIDPEIPAGYMVVVKVSDIVPTLGQLNLGGVIAGVYKPEEGDAEHHSESFAGFTEYGEGTGIYLVCDEEGTSNPAVVVIMNDGDMGNGVTIEKGIYFLKTDESVLGDAAAVSYVESVSFNGVTEFNKRDVLKAEHMSIIEEAASDTLSWDGDTEGRTNALGLLYHVSDAIPTGEHLINGGSITLNFQGSDVEKVYFGNNMIFDVDEFGDGQLGEGTVCIIVNTGLGVTPFIFIAKKPNATFNWAMNDTLINAVFEKPGVYFPYDQTGLFASPGSRASSFSINGYRGFTRRAVKQEHMPVVSGTIKVSTFGEPVVAYRWLNENFGKKIVKVRVTDYPNTSLAGEYDWTFDKVTKETGNGSDGYLYYPSNTPASNLSTTYYAFHSMKSSNPTPDGVVMNFLRGGLYQNQFFIREGSLAVGTEGVTWSFDKELRNNKINVNNAGAQDTGWKIEFYYIEE